MSPCALQTIDLTKAYGSRTVVDHLSLQVQEGEVFGFLGPNGAGKTTSIQMMVGLLQPTSGEVCIEGRSLHAGGDGFRAVVGVAPQENILWEKLTCLEQLEYMGEMYGMTRRAARKSGLELLAALGLESRANDLCGRLSGGMKRRLNLALALVHDPRLIFLDEPEAGLDPQSRVLVREYIRGIAHRKTIVLTTHDMDEAERLADRVAIIDTGCLLVLDSPEALKRSLGDGDTLELAIDPSAAPQAGPEAAVQALKPLFENVVALNGSLIVRGRGVIECLGEILRRVQTAGYRTGDVRLRANTLEDVFLSLTGRKLRE
jgi:ABC-2 type transport system ATP-binding protein